MDIYRVNKNKNNDPSAEKEMEKIRNQPVCWQCGSIHFLQTGSCMTCAVCGEQAKS